MNEETSMDDQINLQNSPAQRKTFIMLLFQKITNEYKALLKYTRSIKPFKIIEIERLSSIPGETKFIIQVVNKNTVMVLTAAEIINTYFDLNVFSKFHATLIRQAASGNLVNFFNLSDKEHSYKIISKKIDRLSKQVIFTIETREKIKFTRTADELSKDRTLLENLNFQDIYDIGYTNGTEQILKEKTALLLIKR